MRMRRPTASVCPPTPSLISSPTKYHKTAAHLPNVHAIGANRQRHIYAVVDEQGNAPRAAHLQHFGRLHRERGEGDAAKHWSETGSWWATGRTVKTAGTAHE